MTILYDHSCFLGHETGDHPERAQRIRRIADRLQRVGLVEKCRSEPFEPAPRRWIARVHSASYIDEVWAMAKSGGGDIEADTVVGPESYDVALRAAGCVCDAVRRLVAGEDRRALCLVRPPWHHATVNRAMGFCLFNNVAVAARLAVDELGLDRVLIVDFDVHHGNGTQAAFWEDPRVAFLSIHRWPFYPGTGHEAETGQGDGLGTTLNLPVELGTSRQEYLKLFADRLEQFAAKIRPELVILSAGFDAHREDPMGNLGLETEDYRPMTIAVLDAADVHAQGRLISVLEGGYNPPVLADCIELHLAEIVRRDGA